MHIKKFSLILAALLAFAGGAGAQEKQSSAGIAAASPAASTEKLPRLVDLGASKCIPCKMMAPILADLKKGCEGRLVVECIDVWKSPDSGKEYGVKIIPTQIFYNAEGRELFRHEGFFGKEDILAKWKELGVDLGAR